MRAPPKKTKHTASDHLASVHRASGARASTLASSQALGYRSLFESPVVGIFVGSVVDGVTDANDTFLGMVGYERGDLPIPWDRLTAPESCGWDRAQVTSPGPTAVISPFETEYVRKDGERLPVLVAGALVKGSADQYVGLALDQTERREAREALAASDARYRTLYQNIPLMYFTLDTEGIVLAVNAQGAQQLGYTGDELVGESVFGVFHPEDREGVLRQIDSVMRAPGTVGRWEFRKIRKDGSIMWVRESAVACTDETGTDVVLVVCEDATEYREVQEKLAKQRRQLEMLASEVVLAEERERGRIARGLHDDIGHRLALIRGQLSRLSKGVAAAQVVDGIRDLLDQAIAHTRSLTFELSSPILQELGLGAAVERLGEEMSLQGGFRFDFETDHVEHAVSPRTALVLHRASRELLVNVIKHAAAHRVSVSIREEGPTLHLSVKDDGRGFDADGLTEGFSREGTFGLFSIRQQVDHIGGRFTIDATKGKGTTAVIRVPLEPASRDLERTGYAS